MQLRSTLTHWVHGIRFYIAIGIVLLSLQTWWWAAASYGGSSLYAIRLEEAYAWFAVGSLCLALAIGPLCAVYRRIPGRGMLYDARRMLGIGVAVFASLHIGVAYLSLFKDVNLLHIPGDYRPAFIVGGVAWLILLAMAFTSFDAAFRGMGKWWFRLHRFVYAAIALTLLHAFIIGAQSTRPLVLGVLAATVSGLLGLHCIALVRQGRPVSNWQLVTVGAMAAALMIIFSYGYTERTKHQVSSGQGSSHAAAL